MIYIQNMNMFSRFDIGFISFYAKKEKPKLNQFEGFACSFRGIDFSNYSEVYFFKNTSREIAYGRKAYLNKIKCL
jgi:hypothetical protein